ncbi:MAG: hypothetical protein AAGA85_13890 [Bacteroidota bacterium]
MTQNRQPHRQLERYEQYFSPQDGKHYEITWKTLLHTFKTDGTRSLEVQCLELVPDSVMINERNSANGYRSKVTLALFNESHPREQLDLRSNCHGFTLADGEYFINNEQVPRFLADEFTAVPADEALRSGEFDIVCFKEPLAGEWIHSAKFRHGRYLHKHGMHPYKMHGSIRDIVAIPDFCDAIPYYFRRNSRALEALMAPQEALSDQRF